jgi:glutamate N-acetyltransferase/amino-acid N-acetyltransferase
MNLFTSRWAPLPVGVREVIEGGLPAGFRAGALAAGIKPSGKLDLGLLICDQPDATSAARFTRSGVQAAPVMLTRERCHLGQLRAVVANSGNANAATGHDGYEVAAAMQSAAAAALGVGAHQVAVCSTGVIGVQLDPEPVIAGISECAQRLTTDGGDDFQRSIMTTDAFEKRATIELALSGGPVRISAQAKGAGMIQPSFATMLCFIETDAKLEDHTAELLLSVTVKRSFDRISVDGQLSTNDAVVLIASGASGVTIDPESDDELRFGEALDGLLRALAIAIVRDGEGAVRVGRVVVHGGSGAHVERVARTIANSPLVKTALHGGDPNWGRIAQAAGMAIPDSAPLPVDIAIEGMQVCVAGQELDHDRDALAVRVSGDEIEYTVGLPGEGHQAECFFSDLSPQYISINADYTS